MILKRGTKVQWQPKINYRGKVLGDVGILVDDPQRSGKGVNYKVCWMNGQVQNFLIPTGREADYFKNLGNY